MTRLDASNEPSMEDILASIRKIIAEEPPGSRPLPPTPPRASEAVVPSPVISRAFQLREPQFEQPAPDRMPELNPYSSGPSADIAVYPSLSMPSATFAAPAVAEAHEPQPEPARIAPLGNDPVRSVDDQLSDLLGDDPVGALPVAANTPSAALQKFDFAAMMIGRPKEAAAAGPQELPNTEANARPGFTVSRDGYIPAESRNSNTPDPFDFDLGPSPFDSKTTAAEAVFAAAATEQRAADLVADAIASGSPLSSLGAPLSLSSLSVASQQPEPIEFAAGVHVGSPAPAVEIEPTPIASVVATIESVSAASPVFSPPVFSAPVFSAQVSAPQAVQEPIVSVVAAINSVAPSPVVAGLVHLGQNGHSAFETAPREIETVRDVIAPSGIAPLSRSMEDTVADLLRPMLKTWLAENMPKIVEHALRREISDSSLSEHKDAAE